MHRADAEAGKRVRDDTLAVAPGKTPSTEIELDVGAFEALVAACKAPGADAVAGERPGMEQHVLDPGYCTPHQVVADIIERDRPGAAIGEADVKMVLQLTTHPGHVTYHRNAVLAQEIGRAEPGKLQKLRRVEDATADQDFASSPCLLRHAALGISDAACLAVLEQHLCCQRFGLDQQIGAVLGLTEISGGGAPATRRLHRALEVPGTVLVAAVEILI